MHSRTCDRRGMLWRRRVPEGGTGAGKVESRKSTVSAEPSDGPARLGSIICEIDLEVILGCLAVGVRVLLIERGSGLIDLLATFGSNVPPARILECVSVRVYLGSCSVCTK